MVAGVRMVSLFTEKIIHIMIGIRGAVCQGDFKVTSVQCTFLHPRNSNLELLVG